MAAESKPKPKAKQKKVERRLSEQRVRNLERALAEERLGLAAIAKAFIAVHGDGDALARRLDAMVAAVTNDPKVKPRTKDAFLYGQQTFARAWAVHQGKPQPLFDPDTHVGHPPAAQVKALSEPPDATQMGMAFNGDNPHAEVQQQRNAVADAVEDNIVRLVREHGALTDPEISYRYSVAGCSPHQSATALKNMRVEMVRTGRLVKGEQTRRQGGKDVPTWDVVERTALT